jgi:hypothetical protein
VRELRRDFPVSLYLFVTGHGGPMTPAMVRKRVADAGELVKFPPSLSVRAYGTRRATEGRCRGRGYGGKALNAGENIFAGVVVMNNRG